MKIYFRILAVVIIFSVVESSDEVDPFRNIQRICTQTLCGNTNNENESTKAAECRCDKFCHNFGDCCFDAPTATFEHPITTYNTTTCIKIPALNQSIYIKRFSTLPGYFTDCKKSYLTTPIRKYPIFKIPVTSVTNGITYGNYYCALGDGRHDNYQFWYLDVQCPSINFTITFRNNSKPNSTSDGIFPPGAPQLKYNSQQWFAKIGTTNEICALTSRPPKNLEPFLRPCNKTMKFVNKCSNDNKIQDPSGMKCPGYRSAVTDSYGTRYRNEYCAICAGVNTTDIKCATPAPRKIKSARFSLRSRWEQRNTNTSKKSSKKRAYAYLQVETPCTFFLKKMNFTKVTAETIYYDTINRTYIRSKNAINGKSIKICPSNSKNKRTIINQKSRILENILLIISDIFLIIHLINFLLPKSSKNINQKCLTCFALVVFIANTGMLIADDVNENHSKYKLMTAIVCYFAFISIFSWLSCMAFEVLRTIYITEAEFNQTEVNKKRFWTYFLISFIIPILFTVRKKWYGYIDFIGGSTRITYLLYDEVLIALSANLAFYVCSVYFVRIKPETNSKLSEWHGINFKLFTYLLILTDLIYYIIFLNEDVDSPWLLIIYSSLSFLLSFVILIYSPVQIKLYRKILENIGKFPLLFPKE